MLLCCEFASNNSEQASTGPTPFYLNFGMHPLTPSALAPTSMHAPEAANRLQSMHQAQAAAKEAIAEAQCRLKAYADRSRSAVTYNAGQKVLLKLIGRPQQLSAGRKLRPERAGPFPIVEWRHQ